jgi:spermidine synthase
VELDQRLTDLVRAHLPLPRGARVRVRAGDARAGLAALPTASADVVVSDVFAGARTPAHLTTVEYAAEGHRVLRPGGVLAANVADGPPLRHARAQVATLCSVFRHVCLLAEPGTLRGRRFGNLVAVASDAELPVAALTRRCAGDPMPARVVAGDDLTRFAGRAQPVHDADAAPSPEPPPGVFGR